MTVADVYKNGVLAASLIRRTDRTEFRYRPEYLAGGGPPVATTLPLSDSPVVGTPGSVPPFFAGLLPEGRRLTALRLSIKASADDEFTLLLAVGRDAVGDVQVVAGGTPLTDEPPAESNAPDVASISFNDYVGQRAPVEFAAIAGVQDKYSGRMFAMPVRRAGREFILKLEPPELQYVVENESYFLALSRSCGIPTVETEIIRDKHGAPGLLVTRFDRAAVDAGTRRIAVEDGCQVLGLWPADKYSTTAEELMRGLATRCRATPVALSHAFRQFVFSLLTGNGDLHAKNMSIVHARGFWEIAPAYDLPSTIFYGDTTTALPAGGKRSNFSRRQLLELAERIGLRTAAADEIIRNLLEGTERMLDEIDGGALPFDRSQLKKPLAELRNRRKLTSG